MSEAMWATLRPHPQAADCTVRDIRTGLRCDADGTLHLRFDLTGDLGRVRLPAPQPAGPADGLWAHTCCEAFIAVTGHAAYREFNFSPSGQWAIYDFDDYRARAATTAPLSPPAIAFTHDGGQARLEAAVAPAMLPAGGALQIGLSVVIEAGDGTLCYWALHHPEIRPDFHHRDAFTLTFAPPRR